MNGIREAIASWIFGSMKIKTGMKIRIMARAVIEPYSVRITAS